MYYNVVVIGRNCIYLKTIALVIYWVCPCNLHWPLC